MTRVCVGWLRTHPSPITLWSDGKDDRVVSYGMCDDCQREWEAAMAERAEERRAGDTKRRRS